MIQKIFAGIFCLTLLSQIAIGQVTTKKINNIQVASSQAKLLGKTKTVRESTLKPITSKIKKKNSKIEKKVPDNFKWRRNISKAVDLSKEHQGVDPVLQSELQRSIANEIEVIANFQGRGSGSPSDPTGDVNNQYYVQAVNATDVGVYNLDGTLEMAFPMNTLWSQFGANSAGDPIILFDEVEDRWFVTEFTDPANVLIAVSETNDPLGAYFAYNFSTPNFPDYPKYAITPDALVITTNEEGPGSLHQYFLDKKALIAGDEEVAFQRIAIVGPQGSEQGFIVSTPVDWNGTIMPYDNRPITIRLNDSSWTNGPDEDAIEIYSFNVDFANSNNTTVDQTRVTVSPYDGFPCSATGPGFACIPQLNGNGLDGIPEVIMNVPHQRNFGSHESIVLSFVTDATDGQNRAGVRWMEMRRTANTEWSLYQEGTFAPDDGLDRFMSSIAIDSKGNICLGYNVSSADTYASIRATGRNANDPLGVMTYDELLIREGLSTINAGGRFGDYSQMSVAPEGKSDFWFTTEYAGPNNTISNITGMRLRRDSFDLALSAFITPTSLSSDLTEAESVTVQITNSGINPMNDFTLGLMLDGAPVDMATIPDTLQGGENMEYTFTNTIDLSDIRQYNLMSYVNSPIDLNPFNDTLRLNITKLPSLEAGITANINPSGCEEVIAGSVLLTNLGGDIITSATLGVTINGVPQPNLEYTGSISYDQSNNFVFSFDQNLIIGQNEMIITILSLNDQSNDFDDSNNQLSLNTEILDPSSFVLIRLVTDEYPEETSYSITGQNSEEVFFEFSDIEQDLQFSIIDQKVCLPLDSCFTLTLNDTYGDGICCQFGEGSLTILDNLGNIIAFNDGDFGGSTTIEFCATAGDCNLSAEIVASPSTSSVSEDGTIMITAMNGIGPYQYSIDGGTAFQEENIFSNLSPGDYTVLVEDTSTDCFYEETVTIDFGSSTHYVNGASIQVDILPNPTDGVFKIKVSELSIRENFLDIEIYDIQGKLLQNREIGKYDNEYVGTFSLYAYPEGTYLVRIIAPNANFLERIIKQ